MHIYGRAGENWEKQYPSMLGLNSHIDTGFQNITVRVKKKKKIKQQERRNCGDGVSMQQNHSEFIYSHGFLYYFINNMFIWCSTILGGKKYK